MTQIQNGNTIRARDVHTACQHLLCSFNPCNL